MTEELVRRQETAAERLSTDQIKFLASSSFVPAAYRGKLPEIMACIATGRELGLGDMESLRLIYVVDGRPSLSAEAMTKLARRRGHSITGEYGDGKVTVRGRRADNADEMTVTWSMAMADRAKDKSGQSLSSKANWRNYPEAMLWARAVSQLCRMLFPDVLGGVSHTPDELELTAEEKISEVAELGPVDVELFEEIAETDPPSFDAADTSDSLFEPPAPEVHERARRARKANA